MSLSLELLECLVAFETASDRPNLNLINYTETFLRTQELRG